MFVSLLRKVVLLQKNIGVKKEVSGIYILWIILICEKACILPDICKFASFFATENKMTNGNQFSIWIWV
jgi:hypothetical protein